MRKAAMHAYRQRRQEVEDAELERQLRAILAAFGAATRRFGIEPERFYWSTKLRCPVVSYDGSDVELAQTHDGAWHMVHVCDNCGEPIHGSLVVRDLAEVGAALVAGPDCDDYDDHFCVPRDLGKRLSDYVDVKEVA